MRQPIGSSLCGQTCVAMLLDIDLDDVIAEFHSRGGTRTRQIKFVLESHGYCCADKLKIINKKNPRLPDICICKVKWKNSNHSHWILKHHNDLHDPEDDDVMENINWTDLNLYSGDTWISSYLEIRKE